MRHSCRTGDKLTNLREHLTILRSISGLPRITPPKSKPAGNSAWESPADPSLGGRDCFWGECLRGEVVFVSDRGLRRSDKNNMTQNRPDSHHAITCDGDVSIPSSSHRPANFLPERHLPPLHNPRGTLVPLIIHAGMAELVDAPDLGSGIARCAGSSPVPGTTKETQP